MWLSPCHHTVPHNHVEQCPRKEVSHSFRTSSSTAAGASSEGWQVCEGFIWTLLVTDNQITSLRAHCLGFGKYLRHVVIFPWCNFSIIRTSARSDLNSFSQKMKFYSLYFRHRPNHIQSMWVCCNVQLEWGTKPGGSLILQSTWYSSHSLMFLWKRQTTSELCQFHLRALVSTQTRRRKWPRVSHRFISEIFGL